LSGASLRKTLDRLARMTLAERKNVTGLEPTALG